MFKHPGQPHGMVKIYQLVKLDVHPDVFRQSTGEELGLLEQIQMVCVCQASLERRHIRVHHRREGEADKVGQVISGQCRAKALMTQKLEVVPQWSAHVAFEDVVPLLLVVVHVERSQPHLVNLPGELAMEEGFTPVNPS
jgi:hypothetical protein